MSLIGEAIATVAIEILFDKLASSELLQFALRENIHADLKKWEKKLKYIKAVLDDAEETQLENQSVKKWLEDLKNLAYDMGDILDEFATEVLRRKLVDQSQANTGKVKKIITSSFTGFCHPQSIKFNFMMSSQIKEITTRLEAITTQNDILNQIENSGGSRPVRVGYPRLPETSLSDPHIYGREEDKEVILELLLKDESTDGTFSVISIVGMGGMGKTTLAQLAYNDVKVDAFFDFKDWICVSEDFNVIGITKTILQSTDFDNLDLLQVALKEKLSGKKFLIVLDDVWNEDYEAWTLLCRPFQAGSSGSKILVTTRNRSVSSVVGSLQTYHLKKLSNDDCLSVFTQHSLGKKNFGEHKDLEEIGKKIMERCDGLPLAAKTLGGLLHGKLSRKDWEDVLNDKIWNLQEARSGILPSLRVSYHYLPPHLKRCFAYCSIFPKYYELCKADIILLWMAEGFLDTDSSEKQKEDLGNEYFEDLHSRSFFQPSSSNASSFMMHDLIHDLAEWAAGDFCFRVENMSEDEKRWKISESIRHLSHLNYGPDYDRINKFEAFNSKMKSLRTFLTLPWKSYYLSATYLDFPCVLLQLRRLRVLSLYGYPISKLPNSIGDMRLLRYLDLSRTSIKFLPDSINTLYNLEALLLKRCYLLERLCSDMGNLIKLRHLIVDDENHLEAMPLGIGKLTRLRTLQPFVVGKDVGSRIRELKDLTHLHERLHISKLENVNDSGDAEKADLNGKGDLKDLVLEWSCNNDGSDEEEIAAQVFEKLLPCQKLESLWIKGYGGTRFPQWLGDTSLSSLVTLKFENCKNCAHFPSIGQLPSLKKLVIRNMDGIERLGPELYGHGYSTVAPFQSLEEFEIHNLQEWRDWSPCGSGRNVEEFPRLRQLSIVDCPQLLGKLPEHLPSLENLYISNCNALQSLPTEWMHSSNTCLKNLSIKYCNSLTCIARVHLPPNLKLLKILFCSNLVTLLDNEQVSGSCKNTSCLEHLKINCCPSLTSLWSKGNELPDTLRKIELSRCNNITTLASTGNLPKALRYLSIERCSKLESIAKGFHDNTKLEKLYISDCEKLETLPSSINNLISLKKLRICRCPAMVYIPEGGFPTSLTSLVIEVSNICKSLFEWGLHRLTSLEVLNIDGGCPDVKSFPQEETGMILPTSLTKLHIWDFWNLKRLSSIAPNLTCLENLSLYNCPKLEYFPDDGLPKSLKQLGILYCPLLEARCKEGEGLYWPMIAHITDNVFYIRSYYSYSSEEEEE